MTDYKAMLEISAKLTDEALAVASRSLQREQIAGEALATISFNKGVIDPRLVASEAIAAMNKIS